jgi:hypothetical protein
VWTAIKAAVWVGLVCLAGLGGYEGGYWAGELDGSAATRADAVENYAGFYFCNPRNGRVEFMFVPSIEFIDQMKAQAEAEGVEWQMNQKP